MDQQQEEKDTITGWNLDRSPRGSWRGEDPDLVRSRSSCKCQVDFRCCTYVVGFAGKLAAQPCSCVIPHHDGKYACETTQTSRHSKESARYFGKTATTFQAQEHKYQYFEVLGKGSDVISRPVGDGYECTDTLCWEVIHPRAHWPAKNWSTARRTEGLLSISQSLQEGL